MRSIDHGAHHKGKASLVIAKVAVAQSAQLAQLTQLGQEESRSGSTIIKKIETILLFRIFQSFNLRQFRIFEPSEA